MSAEEIWQNGVITGKTYEFDIKTSVGDKLTSARELVGMKQTELAEITGIYQADISKIERGLANPSLLTLKRLADGMGMKLNIEFIAK
ncbi:MAG: helix-turn-helix transcriptional regulator [Tyzzerella sp.]|nr:helix-turn-helix transcriptional regulator [Tyzzerella sp.]